MFITHRTETPACFTAKTAKTDETAKTAKTAGRRLTLRELRQVGRN